jgi:DNA-binding response OmpR family regulator
MFDIMKILLVDDNQDITALLSKFLEVKGFENVVTNDPKEGLERIKEENYSKRSENRNIFCKCIY